MDYSEKLLSFQILQSHEIPEIDDELHLRKTVLVTNPALSLEFNESNIEFDNSENPITLLFDKRGE